MNCGGELRVLREEEDEEDRHDGVKTSETDVVSVVCVWSCRVVAGRRYFVRRALHVVLGVFGVCADGDEEGAGDVECAGRCEQEYDAELDEACACSRNCSGVVIGSTCGIVGGGQVCAFYH